MMNKLRAQMFILLLVSLFGVVSMAQQPQEGRVKDHEALRALRSKVTEAMNKKDAKALRECFAKEFVFTGVDQTVVTSEDGLKAYNNKMFEAPGHLLKSITCNPEATILTKFIGDDAGYCYGVSNDTYTLANGKTAQMPCKWTALVVKEDGQWKIAAAQAGADILDNPILKRTESATYKLGAGGLILGLLLGLILGALVFRMKKA